MAGVSDVGESEKRLTKIQQVRRDIDAERLIRKLNSVIFGRTKLRPDQQFAIKTQLNKVMPDLQAMEFRGESTVNVVQSTPLSGNEWLAKYSVEQPEKPAIATSQPSTSPVPVLDSSCPGLPGFVPAQRDSDG